MLSTVATLGCDFMRPFIRSPLNPGHLLQYKALRRPATHRSSVARRCVPCQDKQVCEEVRRNLDAGVYRGGVLSPKHEQAVAWFQARVAEAYAPPSARAAE